MTLSLESANPRLARVGGLVFDAILRCSWLDQTSKTLRVMDQVNYHPDVHSWIAHNVGMSLIHYPTLPFRPRKLMQATNCGLLLL
jgi:hypothetical protein